MAKYVIVGGVAGGASAAARLRRLDEKAEIFLYEKGSYISFANCGLPYYVGGPIANRNSLLVMSPALMTTRFRVNVRLENEVTEIDTKNKKVISRCRGEYQSQEYDKLILATGSKPRIPNTPGMESERVFTLWTIPDADRLNGYLAEHSCKKAVVIGGGFVGVEAAENLCARGLDVTIVQSRDQVMKTVDFEMSQYLHRELNRNGVHLVLGAKVCRVDETATGLMLTLTDGRTVETDIAILSAGIEPNTALAKAAGIKLGPKGHVLVDEHMKTSNDDIYAVGDMVEVVDFVSGKKTAVPLAGPANKQGRIAADNLCGINSTYRGAMGTNVAKVFSKVVSSTGLTERELRDMGKTLHTDFEVVYNHSNNHAGYYPGSTPLHLKVIYDVHDGKILGAQAVGEEGTEKRIDVLATVMRLGGTVEDLSSLELAYAPPFNTAKDPVNFIGLMIENITNGLVKIMNWSELDALDRETYQIVDTRTEAEYASGHYKDAMNLPLDSLREKLDALDHNKKPVVYCRAGLRSYIAARILIENGFDAYSVTGGYLTYEGWDYVPGD